MVSVFAGGRYFLPGGEISGGRIAAKQKKATDLCQSLNGSGSVLTSRDVSVQVLSALKSLTSVFGMGTGGSSSPLPPLLYYFCVSTVVTFSFPRTWITT